MLVFPAVKTSCGELSSGSPKGSDVTDGQVHVLQAVQIKLALDLLPARVVACQPSFGVTPRLGGWNL